MNEEEKTGSFVFTPTEVASATISRIKEIQEARDRAVRLPASMGSISSYFAPVYPGQLVSVIAQTSHGKSLFMHFVTRELGKSMLAAGRTDECIIHVSVEEDIEEQGMLEVAHYSGESISEISMGNVVDWEMVMHGGLQLANVPVYRIGASVARSGRLSDLYLSRIAREILWAKEQFGLKIAALFVDYLQALPIDPEVRRAPYEEQRRLQVREDIYRLREASKYLACPVWVGVQAKQKLEGAPNSVIQIPGQYDGEESAAIGQRSDRILSLWMPKQSGLPVGKVIDSGGISFTVSEDLLFVRVAKQRGNLPSGRIYKCRIDFSDYSIVVEGQEKDPENGSNQGKMLL